MSLLRLLTQTFTGGGTTSNWVCPSGVYYIFVVGCGAGGGGGGGAGTSATGTGGAYANYRASGGGGGQAARTCAQTIPVSPGVSYPISIGSGGAGGAGGVVHNGSDGGGVSPGHPGEDGESSVFGSYTFLGGKGGRRGEIFYAASGSTANNSGDVDPIADYSLQELIIQGMLIYSVSLTGFSAANGDSNIDHPGGGGGGGGISNHRRSTGGAGGYGAHSLASGRDFAHTGYAGTYGGGGGGGGGGENYNHNNTGSGAAGGAGGSGFIEVSWWA